MCYGDILVATTKNDVKQWWQGDVSLPPLFALFAT